MHAYDLVTRRAHGNGPATYGPRVTPTAYARTYVRLAEEPRMTTIVPPAYSKVATPNAEVATLGDLLDYSRNVGAPACGVYRVMKECPGVDSERFCDCLDA